MSTARIEAEVGLRTQPLESGLHRAQGLVNKFKKGTSSAVGGAVSFATGPILAAVGAVTAAFSLGKIAATSFHKAAHAEQTQTAFTTLLGSAEKAKSVLAQLKSFSDVTPFEPGPIIAAGRSLLAMGTDAKDLIPTLRKIGDVASGLGGGEEGLEGLVELFSKARTQGRIYGEEIRQLTGRGVPIIQEFAKQFGVTEDQVHKLGEEGKITFANLDQAFTSLTAKGGKFAGGMAAQSGTMLGLLSTLQGRISSLYTKFGTPINNALKPMIEAAIPIVDKIAPLVSKAASEIAGFITMITTLFAGVGQGTMLIDGFRLQGATISEILWLALKVGFGKAVNALVGMLTGTVSAFLVGFGGGLTMLFNDDLWTFILAGLAAVFTRVGEIALRAFSLPISYVQAGIEKAFQVIFEAVDYLKVGFTMAMAIIRAGFSFAKQEMANLLSKLPKVGDRFKGEAGAQSYSDFVGREMAASGGAGGESIRPVDSFEDLQAKYAAQSSGNIAVAHRMADTAGAAAMGAGGRLLPDLKVLGGGMKDAFVANSAASGVIDTRSEEGRLAAISLRGQKSLAQKAAAASAADAPTIPMMRTKSGGLAPTISADSLARIGGGGNISRAGNKADPQLREAQKHSGLLETIAKNTGAAGKELRLP